MPKKSYNIPFSKDAGDMLSWAYEDYDKDVCWKENYVFEDELEYVGATHGRSSMSMKLKSKRDGKKYFMFWTYFDSCIRRDNNLVGPIFVGKWTFIKCGQNYSVCPAEEIK